MKRIVLILLVGIGLASSSSTYKSYPIENAPNDINKTTLYYSVPMSTEVVFDVTFIKTIRQKGIFANQSNLLGVKNVTNNDEVKYEVKDISDFYKKYKKEKTLEFIKESIKYLKQYE